IINTYNNIENRDIWEYHLNLTASEQRFFVDHLYEMRMVRIPYFFLNKNCSYMILEMLEAVRPTQNLIQDFTWHAIPLDTLKAVQRAGFIDNVHYRPAQYTQIQARIKQMNHPQIVAFKQILAEKKANTATLSEAEQAAVLETVYQLYRYKFTAKDMSLADYRRKSFAALRQRSKFPAADNPKIEGNNPIEAHQSQQVAFSAGAWRQRLFYEAAFRPAYTALTDNHFGLIKGAGIKVLESRWRYFPTKHRLLVQEFTLLDILSLSPIDAVFSPWSYHTNVALKREYNPKTLAESYVATLHFGLGKTVMLNNWLWAFGLLEIGGEYGGFVPNNQYVAVQPEIGFFTDFERFRGKFSVHRKLAAQQFGNRLIYQAKAGFDLTRNASVFGKYTAEYTQHGHNMEEFQLGWRYHF
ncbi:MAG: DUF4105 domain-containing protein, partial [Alphaproteobacteria bacterium]|nr:DUF4105 domain-containing protein [Alphaproteobacteria bacterium]